MNDYWTDAETETPSCLLPGRTENSGAKILVERIKKAEKEEDINET